MRQPLLPVAILVSATLLGFLNYKLKPRPDENDIRDYAQNYRESVAWQNQIAPDFQLTSTTGQTIDLSQMIGRQVIVLNFFTTWCGPCRQEMPEFNSYYQAHKNDSYVLLGIDAAERPDLVDGYIKELHLEFPVAIDEGSVLAQYHVTAYPTTVVIGLDGKIQLYESGAIQNADVVFDPIRAANDRIRKAGRAISPEDYQSQSREHPKLLDGSRSAALPPPPAPKLDQRADRIVTKMDCPCGCDKKVFACTCHTSKNVKNALSTEDFKNSSDVEIIHALNKRFCGGDM
jgi:peroxiredoxin